MAYLEKQYHFINKVGLLRVIKAWNVTCLHVIFIHWDIINNSVLLSVSKDVNRSYLVWFTRDVIHLYRKTNLVHFLDMVYRV